MRRNATDASMEAVREARSGETVGGTTADDYHDEHTRALPSFIDPDDLTPEERTVLETKALHPDWTLDSPSDRGLRHIHQ